MKLSVDGAGGVSELRYDAGGNYASVGRVNDTVLRAYLAHEFFQAPPPKSLDRYDFPLEPLEVPRTHAHRALPERDRRLRSNLFLQVALRRHAAH